MNIPEVGKDEINGYFTGCVITVVTSISTRNISARHPAESIGTTFIRRGSYNGYGATMPPVVVGKKIIMTLVDGKPVGWRYINDKMREDLVQ